MASKSGRKTVIFLAVAMFLSSNLHQRPTALPTHQVDEIKSLYKHYFSIRKSLAEKNINKALAGAKELVEQSPSFYEIYPVLAKAARESQNLNLTIEFLQRLIKKHDGNPFFHYGLAICCYEQKDVARAVEGYKNAINFEADFIWPYYYLVMSAKNEEFEELKRFFEEKLRASPGNSYLAYSLGTLYEFKIKNFELALAFYKKALQVAQDTGRESEVAKHLNTIGNYCWGRSQFARALEYYEEALRVNGKYQDLAERARFLSNCALMNCYLGNVLKGREYYFESLECDREIGHKIHEAQVLRGIGLTYYRQGDYEQALRKYEQALKLARDFTDERGEGRYLADLADVHWVRGNYQEALAYHAKALLLSQEIGDTYNEISTLLSMGNIYWTVGDFSKALEIYLQALEVNRKLGLKTNEASLMVNIGNIHKAFGNGSRALDYYEKSLAISREIADRYAEGTSLNNIGWMYLENQNFQEGLKYFQQALEIAQGIQDKKAQSIRQNNIAATLCQMDNFSEALRSCDESLKLARDIGSREQEAHAFKNLGFLYLKAKHFKEATQSFGQSLSIAQELALPTVAWPASWGLAQALEKQGNLKEALAAYKKSIETIEGIRAQMPLEEQKVGFLADKIKVYDDLIQLLCELSEKNPVQGYDREAYYFAEKAKARAFLDALQEARINLKSGLAPGLRQEETELAKEITGLQTELIKPSLTESKREELLKKLQLAEEEYKVFIQKIKRDNAEYAALILPEPRRLEEIQDNLLDDETALLEYFISDDGALLFYVTKKGFSIHPLPLESHFPDRAADFAKILSTREAQDFEFFTAGKRLSEELLGPVEKELGNFKKLIIIPDGKLHFLPFEALVMNSAGEGEDEKPGSSAKYVHGKYLIQTHAVSYGASASSLLHLRERERKYHSRKDLLAFADPVYGALEKRGEKISADEIQREFYLEQGFRLHALPYSKEEVKKISRFISPKSREIYTQDKAKEERLKELALQGFKVIHFATHGLMDEKTPLRSALVLTLDQDPKEDGFYQAREIFDTSLNADMVVLSACQTGKGRLERGEGMVGLTRAFLYAGAQSVVVSLWNINDLATSEFMGHFYDYLRHGRGKDEALRLAKLKMIPSAHGHPFYWAAFVINGDAQPTLLFSK